jgi:TolA protein
MRSGLTISCVVHVVALGCALIAISASPMNAPPSQALPVEFVTDFDLGQMTKGVKNTKLNIPDPKPLADKVDVEKSVDQQAPKAADKPEITTASAKPKAEQKAEAKPEAKPDKPKEAKAEPKPPPKPEAAAKPEPKPDAKPDAKPDKAKPDKAPDKTLDQIADILKKDEPKKLPPPKPADPDSPAKQNPKFDANQVAALLDKRDPRRQVATAAAVNDTANIGSAGGQAAQLSQSEIDGLRARISQCWSPPPGVDTTSRIYVVLRVLFKPDGSMARDPVLVEGTASALGPALAESAQRALMSCQPFTMLKPEHFDQWKDIELKFDPHELLGG